MENLENRWKKANDGDLFHVESRNMCDKITFVCTRFDSSGQEILELHRHEHVLPKIKNSNMEAYLTTGEITKRLSAHTNYRSSLFNASSWRKYVLRSRQSFPVI